MSSGAESGPVWLYNRGVTSGIIGGWNTTGWKSGGSYFGQNEIETALHIYATSQYSQRGSRTFTSNKVLPATFNGKTLYVKGYFINTGKYEGGTYSGAYVIISDFVQDDSSTLPADFNVQSSIAFANPIYKKKYMGQAGQNVKVPFEIVLPVTKNGYLSVVLFKGEKAGVNDNVQINSYFEEMWVE